MTIDLTYANLKRLAFEGKVTKDGITVKVGRPLLPQLKENPRSPGGSVSFILDPTDPGAEKLGLNHCRLLPKHFEWPFALARTTFGTFH
jgi:hypothetical protein